MLDYSKSHKDQIETYGRENYDFWVEVVTKLDNYTSTLSSELIAMERDHYHNKTPFGLSYNIVAPTFEITKVNRELKALAKSIEQTERIQATR